jgi:exonuclease SbcD
MLKILHFADAHIDMANYGRHDPQSGLPMRVMDFLKSLDAIVETAIAERVDLVLFAGDAYKDRNPAPTFQREWGKRIMRLSKAGIPTLLLVGNHDLSPALGRAHALDPFDTLAVPHIYVVEKPRLLRPEDLEGVPLQVLALPWITRSGMMAALNLSAIDEAEVFEKLETTINEWVQGRLDEIQPSISTVLAAHATVEGAKYGGERTVMLGNDLVLSGALVRDRRLDYVALGHIHKPQDLGKGEHHPIVYPGSIERVDFGEVEDDRFFVIARLEPGATTAVEWRRLEGVRPFIDRRCRLDSQDHIDERLRSILPEPERLEGAIVRLVLEYPRDWESLIDDKWLRVYTASCFEFHLVKRPQVETRVRLPEDQTVGSLSPLELLELYWNATHADPADTDELKRLAAEVIKEIDQKEI